MKRIPLTQGKEALVDDCDYEYLMQWKWYAAKSRRQFYAVRQKRREDGQQRLVLMHQVIAACSGLLGENQEKMDHEDRNGLNNRRANLRLATAMQNATNKGPQVNNTSGAVGVSWCRDRHKWQAKVCSRGHRFQRYFDDFDEAVTWRDAVAKERHGEFAYLNGSA